MTFLLDANVLIALTVDEHEHHDRASRWVASIDDVAVCPIVEGSLVRFLLRVGESAATATDVVRRLAELSSVSFWSDSVSYAAVDMGHVVGHRQVTDAYLAGLARSHGAMLATLDDGLARALPDRVLLLPS